MAANETHFPKDRFEALAMLYVQTQDLSGKSPAEILQIYNSAYTAMKKENASQGYTL